MFKHSLFAVVSLVFVLSCGGSSDSGTTTPPSSIQLDPVPDYQLVDTDTLIDTYTNQLAGLSLSEFFTQSFAIIEERDPQGVFGSGRLSEFPNISVELTNISDEFYFQTVAIKSLIRQLLLTYDRQSLSSSDQLHFDVYKTYLDFEIGFSDYKNFEYPVTYGFFGWPGSTEIFFTQVLPLTNRQEAENYLTLLNQIGRRFEQISEITTARQNAGIVEPFITLDFSRGNVAAIGNSAATATSYYQAFDTALNSISEISAADKQTMRDTLRAIVEQRVLPAYQALAQQMANLTTVAPSNIGFGQFAGGDEFYQYSLSFFTSSNATPDEVHQQGIDELARIHAEMNVLFDQLGYPANESISQKLARASSDGGVIAGNQAVSFYESLIDVAYTKLPEAFSTIPQTEVVVVGGSTGGYYIAGSEDGTRPGAFYANTSNNLPYFTMPTLAYHEAVPGHHLQIALAQELDMPRFRKGMRFTSFIEGWGLYAERLASDLGWYQADVYGDIGRLQFEAMRANRLVVDTGIHSKGWTFQQAEAFSRANIGNPDSIARYSVWPGQATAYMTGMLKILELRQRAETELGASYDIKDFHDVVIGKGSMPLDILEQAIDEYINTQAQN